jgi:alpha-glucosidase
MEWTPPRAAHGLQGSAASAPGSSPRAPTGPPGDEDNMKKLRSFFVLAFGLALFLASTFAAQATPQASPNGPEALPAASSGAANDAWWRHAVIYEIYPRSFADTNADGLGDLNGITAHLDYLQDLGVDAIWITPCFPSPQVDFGYDVSNYTVIAPEYGTMADFNRLMSEVKKHDIKVLLDLVVNHTSDKHPWFVESASSRTNPKADWYIWRDGRGPDGRQAPNNWTSLFGGPAWQWGPQRQQFYYHFFYKEQPDLNWRNPEVRQAMYNVVRFWMDRGVSGFRLDAVDTLFEDPNLTPDPEKPGRNAFGDANVEHVHTMGLPEIHDVFRELRQIVNAYPGGVLVGEVYRPTAAEMATVYGRNDEVNLPMATQVGFTDERSAPEIRKRLDKLMALPKGQTPLLVFDNHDRTRSWDRYGQGLDTAQRDEVAKVVAATLLAPRGSALMYYGQEIGMATNTPTRREDVKDPIGITGWPKEKGRDGERTPMQWDDSKNAGFSTADKTWLPVPPTAAHANVAHEEKNPDSVLSFYKAMLRLRRENAPLRYGDYQSINDQDKNVLSFLRKSAGEGTVLVALNYSDAPQKADYGRQGKQATTLLSNFAKRGEVLDLGNIILPPFGVFIGQVK